MEARHYKYQSAIPIDWKATEDVDGVIVAQPTLIFGKRKVKAWQIDTGSATLQVLECARLKQAMAGSAIGDHVHITNRGTAKLKGGKTCHLLDVAVWTGGPDDEATQARRTTKRTRKARRTPSR